MSFLKWQLKSRDPKKSIQASNTVPERFFNIRFFKIILSIKTWVKRLRKLEFKIKNWTYIESVPKSDTKRKTGQFSVKYKTLNKCYSVLAYNLGTPHITATHFIRRSHSSIQVQDEQTQVPDNIQGVRKNTVSNSDHLVYSSRAQCTCYLVEKYCWNPHGISYSCFG